MDSADVEYADVVICGSGSAGLCAGALLARQGISCTILERNSGPMELGQADGVQCRTVEMFESLGLEDELLRQSYHVLEVAFWSSNDEGKLVRTGRTADTMPGLSHQPHVILNQAIVNRFLLDDMKKNGQPVKYSYEVKSVSVESTTSSATDRESYPVTIITETNGARKVFKAKYALVSMFQIPEP
jgi:phenol 2-monooxygenase